ncbi:hypothetical protein BSKO_10343 [Bryopsis sp. KO-2023]|nr:hypothetical protein BSKO_10343 [Bryopsis sp. KO-2023]
MRAILGQEPCIVPGATGLSCSDATANADVELSISTLSLTGTLDALTLVGDYNFVSLGLPNNALSGSLPESWSALTSLKSIDLSNNGLQGTIPEAWSTMKSLSTL